jgi:hypothetical protein
MWSRLPFAGAQRRFQLPAQKLAFLFESLDLLLLPLDLLLLLLDLLLGPV